MNTAFVAELLVAKRGVIAVIGEEKDDGVLMTDIVTYIPPFGILGDIANTLFIKKQLKEIFDYRFKIMNQKFN